MSRNDFAVFSPSKIGSLRVPNRFVRSATADIAFGRLGGFTDEDVALYRRLAAGGVGLVIVNGPPILPERVCMMNSLMEWTYCYGDIRVNNTGSVLSAIRDTAPDCQIVAQLECNAIVSGDLPAGPSAVTSPYYAGRYRKLSIDEIRALIHATAQTIAHMRDEGFDGVQLHAAHGGGFWHFLSPLGNARTDEYGGSVVNRVRFMAEIIKIARESVGEFPILIKANCTDYIEGGIDCSSFPEFAYALEQAGFDAIEVSGGCWDALLRSEAELGFRPIPAAESHTNIAFADRQNYFLPFIEELDLGIPIILVGGIRNIDAAEAIIQSGAAEFIALCRPLIQEPELLTRWRKKQGNADSNCIACNSCIYSMYLPFDKLGAKTVTCLYQKSRQLHLEAQDWLSGFIDRIRVN